MDHIALDDGVQFQRMYTYLGCYPGRPRRPTGHTDEDMLCYAHPSPEATLGWGLHRQHPVAAALPSY